MLSTDYETMSSIERFSFAGPDVRLRTSTVEGLSNTASFCVETRIVDGAATATGTGDEAEATGAPASPETTCLSALGW